MQYITNGFTDDHYTKKIYVNYNSLTADVCNEIIKLFESEDGRHPGCVFSGVIPKIKDTSDFVLECDSVKWGKIYRMLYDELKYNLKQYIDNLNSIDDYKSINNNTTIHDYTIFDINYIMNESIMVQKYTQNKGRYIYHNDFRAKPEGHRVITFLWYLNDVEIGGETVFEGSYAIRPQIGKLILFPSCWTYAHCGKMPISSDKYIITGWLYKQ
jgi:hypothetical protein